MKKFILPVVFLSAFLLQACNDYGTKLEIGDEDELYYTDNVEEETAQEVGDYLLENNFFFNNDGSEVSAQIDKDGDTYILNFVVKEEKWEDEQVHTAMEMIGTIISNDVLDNSPVEVHICNNKLESQKKIGPVGGK